MSKVQSINKLIEGITEEKSEAKTMQEALKKLVIALGGTSEVKDDTIVELLDIVADIAPGQMGGNLQEKEVTITENGIQTIEADEGYDGLENVNVTTNVPAPAPNLQDKSITISSNAIQTVTADNGYDGLGNVSITTNVPSSGSLDMNTGIKFGNSRFSTLPSNIQNSINWNRVEFGNGMFENCSALQSIPLYDTSNFTTMEKMFYGCESLTSVPQYNSSRVTNMQEMFTNCFEIETVPELDTSSVLYAMNMFLNCGSLSNESLNNILAMCTNVNSNYGQPKTLKSIGLTQTQAQTCMTLSNYQDFLNAGWTTGYGN